MVTILSEPSVRQSDSTNSRPSPRISNQYVQRGESDDTNAGQLGRYLPNRLSLVRSIKTPANIFGGVEAPPFWVVFVANSNSAGFRFRLVPKVFPILIQASANRCRECTAM